MSLRKSTCLTPQRLDAARHNSQRSTGPRSEAGKERMKMNAVKHGCDAAPENEAAVMRALGEDPERYADLQRELATTYGPGDAFWDQQVADLGKLYWRRNRIERMETGLMRDALEGVEERRRRLARDLADVTFEPSRCEAVAANLPQPTHPLVRLRLLISLWGVIRAQVQRRYFSQAHHQQIESYYQDELGWRPRQIVRLLALLYEWARLFQQRGPGKSRPVCEGYLRGRGGAEGPLPGTGAPAGGANRGGGGGVRGGDEGAGAERRDCAGCLPGSGGGDLGNAAAAGSGARPVD